MNNLRQLNQDNLAAINKEYQNRTYNELSCEFQSSVGRVFELIKLMYNRLTLVENFSHKDALAKIQNDHKHLAGFSKRNIRRYLPLDNPCVPRRAVGPRWPKNSIARDDDHSKLSNTALEQEKNLNLSVTSNNIESKIINSNLAKPSETTECSNCIAFSLQNRELQEALEKTRQLTTADKIVSAAVDCSHEFEILPFEFSVSKKEILDYWGEIYLEIADGGMQVWFSGKIDMKNRRVISAGIGRGQHQIDCSNTGDIQNERQ